MIDRIRSFSRYAFNNLQLLAFRSSIPIINDILILKNHPNLHFASFPRRFDDVFVPICRNPSFRVRNYCSSKDIEGSHEFTVDIEYLDESGSVIYSGKGIRSVEPGVDDHIMVGGLKQPFFNASAVAKIVEVVKRWKRGPEMEIQLDKLQFVPDMTHITQYLKIIGDSDASLSLFQWAKCQTWFKPSDECYLSLIDRLNQSREFEGIQSVFNELIRDSSKSTVSEFNSFSRIIQCLAKAEKLEVSFCCFKKIQESR